MDHGRNRAPLEIKRGYDRKPSIAECNPQFTDPPAHPAHGAGRVEESPRYSQEAEWNRQRSATIEKSQYEPDEEGQQETCDRCCNDLLPFHLPSRDHAGASREPRLSPFSCNPIFNDIPVFTRIVRREHHEDNTGTPPEQDVPPQRPRERPCHNGPEEKGKKSGEVERGS